MLSLISSTALFLGAYSYQFDEYNPDGSHTCPEFKEYASPEEYYNVYGETATMGTRVNLTDAMNQNGAVCLDGTVPVFYWRPGTGDGVNKFHVFFQGGGWCAGDNDAIALCMDTCQHRATGALGSSLSYAASANYDNGYMATSQAGNPLSYNWNTVYVKYCDGASFSGNNDTVLNGAKDLHFRGWRILNGVFAELAKSYKWKSATDVLISGCSAGGLTTWLHSDYIYDTYVKPLGDNVQFLSMPDSGFFMEYEGAGKYISGLNWNFIWTNATDAMNKECMADHKPEDQHLCIFAQETAPYVHVKMFPLQSRYDSWQDGQELRSGNATLINEYGANMTKIFEANYVNNAKYGKSHAAFFDSCHHHCGEWNAITIDGMKSSQAQFQFYYGNNTHNKFWFQDKPYPCSSCC
eukprot:482005_1